MPIQPSDAATKDRVFEIVRTELVRIRRTQTPGFDTEIRLESCLIADVGLDSLSLVEAVVGLEQALAIDHLPLESLGDGSTARDGGRFTVESLVNVCVELGAA